MFKFIFRTKKNEISEDEFYLFNEILDDIYLILNNSNNLDQANIVDNLIMLIKIKETDKFILLINGIDFWGGSGAVWEVNIEDVVMSKKFEYKIVELINLMEKAQILGSGIKPIRKLFTSK